jgi:hypothetical protein
MRFMHRAEDTRRGCGTASRLHRKRDQSVRGVEEVEYRVEEGGRQLTWSGIQKLEVIYRFTYDYEGLVGSFSFRTDYRGGSEFHHTYIKLNARPPQVEIAEIRPIMIEIERAIGTGCTLEVIATKVAEHCMGGQCP